MVSMSRIPKKTWIILAAVAAVVLLVIAFASCSAPRKDAGNDDSPDVSPASAVGCYPPLACGPHYAGYIPPYYALHPSFLYLSPYRSLYSPVLVGKKYSVSRTPVGRAPVSRRPAMPYPEGYRPVPGDFQAPTAPRATAPVQGAPDMNPHAQKTPEAKVPEQKAPASKAKTRAKAKKPRTYRRR